MKINKSKVLREVGQLTDTYEQALVSNDTEALKGFFWQSEEAVRIGVAEELYGAKAIGDFRDKRKINFTDRKVLRKTVLALGEQTAVSTLEFTVVVAGRVKHGRQTQVWAQLDVGWRIVSAHVSHKVQLATGDLLDYVDAASRALELPIANEYRASVASNLETMQQVAAPLMALQLDDDLEPAPVFRP